MCFHDTGRSFGWHFPSQNIVDFKQGLFVVIYVKISTYDPKISNIRDMHRNESCMHITLYVS